MIHSVVGGDYVVLKFAHRLHLEACFFVENLVGLAQHLFRGTVEGLTVAVEERA